MGGRGELEHKRHGWNPGARLVLVQSRPHPLSVWKDGEGEGGVVPALSVRFEAQVGLEERFECCGGEDR